MLGLKGFSVNTWIGKNTPYFTIQSQVFLSFLRPIFLDGVTGHP